MAHSLFIVLCTALLLPLSRQLESLVCRLVPEGKKSVTLRLTIGSAEKTLTSQEIAACAASAVTRQAKHVGAELRGN